MKWFLEIALVLISLVVVQVVVRLFIFNDQSVWTDLAKLLEYLKAFPWIGVIPIVIVLSISNRMFRNYDDGEGDEWDDADEDDYSNLK